MSVYSQSGQEMTCHADAEVCEFGGRFDVADKVDAVLKARVGRYPVFCTTRRVYGNDERRPSMNATSAHLREGPICSQFPAPSLPASTLSKRRHGDYKPTHSQSLIRCALHHVRARQVQDRVRTILNLRQSGQVQCPILRGSSRTPRYADRQRVQRNHPCYTRYQVLKSLHA